MMSFHRISDQRSFHFELSCTLFTFSIKKVNTIMIYLAIPYTLGFLLQGARGLSFFDPFSGLCLHVHDLVNLMKNQTHLVFPGQYSGRQAKVCSRFKPDPQKWSPIASTKVRQLCNNSSCACSQFQNLIWQTSCILSSAKLLYWEVTCSSGRISFAFCITLKESVSLRTMSQSLSWALSFLT